MKTAGALSQSLHLSPSELFVADLQSMTYYYRDIVGLSVLETTKNTVTLGYGQTSAIKLSSKPKLAYASPRSAGLFHNAIVFETRGDLAQAAGNTILQAPHDFVGTGDHLVSEAFYFNDLEGNGLELYFDRPADTWEWQNGHVKMDTLYIDPSAYINKHATNKTNTGKKLGHVHLKVGDIANARNFYVNLLGFDITATIPGALFVSIGGYHHHLALNTWISAGAGLRTPTLGFSEVSISLDGNDDLNRLAVRLDEVGYIFTLTGDRLRVNDPWGNTLAFSV